MGPREVLDRLREQLLLRLPKADEYAPSGPVKLDLVELQAVARVAREYLAAEREYAGLPGVSPADRAGEV